MKDLLIYSKPYILPFLIFALLIYISFSISQNFNNEILFYIFSFSSIIFLVIYFTNQRRNEFISIKSVLSKIRNNSIQTKEEIVLPEDLKLLQSEIQSMFTKINDDIEYLKKLEQVRTEFLGNVSHELRTPIFAIQGYLETLSNGAINDPKVNLHFLNKALFHTENLNTLLNDLIEISMIESGEMNFSFRYFFINDFLKPIIDEFKMTANDKNLDLEFIPLANDVKVFGDKNRIRQVINNLLHNSIKYTEKGKISIQLHYEKKVIRIGVKDTGIGIPDKDLPRIFERFYRVDKDRSRSVGGTGLGLAIVKHIVEAHGSKILVKSISGEGSDFFFFLKT